MKRLNSYRQLKREEALRLEALRLAFQFWRVTGKYDTGKIKQVADIMYKYITEGN